MQKLQLLILQFFIDKLQNVKEAMHHKIVIIINYKLDKKI